VIALQRKHLGLPSSPRIISTQTQVPRIRSRPAAARALPFFPIRISHLLHESGCLVVTRGTAAATAASAAAAAAFCVDEELQELVALAHRVQAALGACLAQLSGLEVEGVPPVDFETARLHVQRNARHKVLLLASLRLLVGLEVRLEIADLGLR